MGGSSQATPDADRDIVRLAGEATEMRNYTGRRGKTMKRLLLMSMIIGLAMSAGNLQAAFDLLQLLCRNPQLSDWERLVTD